MRIQFVDIVFWLLIAAIVGIALWLLHGSPPVDNALITVAMFVATSEMMLWRKLFSLDKKTAVSFTRMGNDISNIKNDIHTIKSDVHAIKNEVGDIRKIMIKKR